MAIPFKTDTNKAPTSVGASGVNDIVTPSNVQKYKTDVTAQSDFIMKNAISGAPVFTGSEDEYNSLSAYGAQPNLYQEQTDLERIRAKNQSAWEQAFNSLAQATGQVIGDTVGGFGMLADIITGAAMDEDLYSNFITRAGDSISEAARQQFPIYRENPEQAFDFNDFSGWFFSQLPSVASSLSLMIPASAATKGLSMLGRGALKGLRTSSKVNRAINKAEKLLSLDNIYNAQRVKTIAQTGISSIGMRLGENYQEARGVAEQINEEALKVFGDMDATQFNKWLQENPDIASESDGTKESAAKIVAEKASDRDFAYNAGNVIFDYMQLRALNNFAKGVISRAATPSVSYAQREALNRLSASGLSSTGEVTTSALKKAATDLGRNIVRGVNASRELVVSELSEGIEEAINFVGQEEGTAYGRYLLDKVNSDYSGKAIDINRIENYLRDPQLYNSALWGVIGGVIFGGTMNTINNAITKRKGGMTEDQMRIAEINGREQTFAQYQNQLQTIRNGFNPYEQNEDGTNPQVSETDQVELVKEAQTRFATTLALNAINAGNFELLQDYINDPKLRKKLIDSGIAEAETYDADTQFINQALTNTAKAYQKYANVLQDANVNDAYLDIAIRENIFNEQEASLLQQRIDRLNNRNQELKNTISELQNLDPIQEAGLRTNILSAAKNEILNELTKLEPGATIRDKITIDQLHERIKAIDKLLETDNNILSPNLNVSKIFADEARRNNLNEEESKILKEYFNNTSNTNVNRIYNISPQYVENMQQVLIDQIRQIAYNDRIVTSNQDVTKLANDIKSSIEDAANQMKANAEKTLVSAIDNATEADYDEISRAIRNQLTDEDRQNPALVKIQEAATLIRNSSDDMDAVNEILNRELERAETRAVAITPVEDTSVPVTQPATSPVTAVPVTAPKALSNEVVVDKTAVEQINNIVDKLVGENAPDVITEANINNYNIKVSKAFSSTDLMTGAPVKIKNIRITVSRFGNVAIDGFVGKLSNKPDADVTLEEINAAIANGDITATLKEEVRESAIAEGEADPTQTILDGISRLQERQEEIKLIFSLYSKAVANESIDNKPIISLEGLMRFIQDNNPKAINLLNDIKNVALMLNQQGTIILNDSQEVINSSNQDLTRRIIETTETQVKRTIKETTQTSNFGVLLDAPTFDNMDANNSKLYTTIMNLKKGDKVTLKVNEDGEFEVRSGKVRIGSIPVPNSDVNGNPQVINEFWKYTSMRDNNRYNIPFVEELKNIVSSQKDADKNFVANIYKIKAVLNSIRTNPNNRSLLTDVINELEANDTYKRLVSIYSSPIDSFEDKVTRANHISKILMYDRNLNPNSTNYATLVGESLNQWEQKIGYNYNTISGLYNKISQTKSKSKRISIADTTTGRLLLNNNENGNPRYSNINDVLLSSNTDNFTLYGIENNQIIIRDGSNRVVGQSTNLYDNGNTILYVEDSQGRKIRVNTQGNTSNNGLTSTNDFVNQFNSGITELFDGLAGALLNNDTETFNSIISNIEQYIGNGKMLYGYEFSRDTEGNVAFKPRGTYRGVSEKFNGPIIYFNIASRYPNIKFRYPDGTTSGAMGITTSQGINVASASRKNFNTKFKDIFNYLRRNIINDAFSGTNIRGNETIEVTNEGKMRFKIPSLSNDKWYSKEFDSYTDYIISTGALVTNIDAIKDSKGNILGNFTFTNEGFNSIGLNKNIYLSLIDVTTPVEEVISTKSPAPTNAVRDAIEKGTTPSKLGKVLNANSSYNEVLKSLEDAGLKINSTIESNDRRLASIPVGDNTLTLTNKWLELDSNQQVLKVIHEGIHYYFAKEGIDTTKFNDLYNKFKEFINSPEVNDVVKNTYSKYLNETKEYNVAVEEFVVEAITSREFARLLSSIPYASTTVSDSNNIFTNIIDALLELIGNVSGIDNTILGEIRNRLSKISEINTGEESTNEVIDNNDEIYSEPIAEIEDAFMSDFDGIADIEFDSSIIDSNANLTPTISSLFSRLNYQQQRSLDSLQARDEVNYTCS